MKNTANQALIILSIFLISCNSNDDDTVTEDDTVSENLIITSEIRTVTLTSDNGELVFIYQTTIADNKRRVTLAQENSDDFGAYRDYEYNTNDLITERNYINPDYSDYFYTMIIMKN